MQYNGLRHELRARTRVAHERLDALVGELDSDAAYRRFVVGLYRFRAPVETSLRASRWPEAFGGWRPQAIADALAADLADLGEAVPATNAVDPPEDIEALVGTCYVLEGSSLGARVLIGRAAALGFDSRNGARHLAEQAEDITNWRSFTTLIEELSDLDRVRVVEAANASFTQAALLMARTEHV